MNDISRILLVSILIVLGIASLGAAAYLYTQAGDTAQAPAESQLEVAAAELTEAGLPAAAATPASTATMRAATSPTATAAEPPLLSITLHDEQESRTLRAKTRTVGEFLAENGVFLAENDSVEPAPDTPLADNMQIVIKRAIPLTIQVDGQALAIFSGARVVSEVLARAGILVGELDIVEPGIDTPLLGGETIKIIRVREETIVTDSEAPYQTLYQPSADLDLDTKAVISSGVPGIQRRSTRIRYEDGVEVSREIEGEWMEQEPVHEVIGYGTRITTNVIDTPEGPRDYWRVVNMRVTAYTAASSGKPADHPAYGITASGLPAGTGIVAVDPNVIPFRSEVYVPGYGVGFAGDTGGGVKGRWIDLGYDEDELVAWSSYVDVYYLTPIPAEVNYLIPEVLP